MNPFSTIIKTLFACATLPPNIVKTSVIARVVKYVHFL